MMKDIKALIGSAKAFSVEAGTGDIEGAHIKFDQPLYEQSVAAAYIHNDGTGGNVTITVKARLYSGVAWGKLHNVKDEDGNNITFQANSAETVEANMYAQSWWKENNGWRIVLSRASLTALAGNATAVSR